MHVLTLNAHQNLICRLSIFAMEFVLPALKFSKVI